MGDPRCKQLTPLPHIHFSISGHGFGHIGQCAPVIAELRKQHPEIKISIRSEAPLIKLRERLGDCIELHSAKLDIGMIQKNAVEVDHKKSYQAYQQIHRDWKNKIESEATYLKQQNIDLIIANIPYLTIAAAKQIGIPCLAFCSLNWSEIYNHYFDNRNPVIQQQILDAYQSCELFIAPEPAMQMPGIRNKHLIPPVAQHFSSYPVPIELTERDRLILISWGGMELKMNIKQWPIEDTLHFIVPDDQPTYGIKNIYTLAQLGIPYQQALQHCDLIITKPGYGTFVESALLEKPVAYLPRADWPEMDTLVNWYQQKLPCQKLAIEDVISGQFINQIDLTRKTAPKPMKQANGNNEAAKIILRHLAAPAQT